MEVNNCEFIGNVTKDIQLRQTKNGTAVAQFSIACNRKFNGKDGTVKELTDFVNIQAWGVLAQSCADQLRKGSRVFVQGRFSTRSYEQDGQKRWVTEVVAGMVAIPLDAYEKKGNFEQFGQPQRPTDRMYQNVNNNFRQSPVQEDIPF